jgi:DNA-binding MarR family transcriptional regulator
MHAPVAVTPPRDDAHVAAAHQRNRSLRIRREVTRKGDRRSLVSTVSLTEQLRLTRESRRSTPVLVAQDLLEATARLERQFRRALRDTPYDDLDVARMLLLLGRRRGRLRPSDIADLLAVSRSTATRLVDRADAAGLVDRTYPDLDRRITWCSLTPAGEAARADIERLLDRAARAVLGPNVAPLAAPLAALRNAWRPRPRGFGLRSTLERPKLSA